MLKYTNQSNVYLLIHVLVNRRRETTTTATTGKNRRLTSSVFSPVKMSCSFTRLLIIEHDKNQKSKSILIISFSLFPSFFIHIHTHTDTDTDRTESKKILISIIGLMIDIIGCIVSFSPPEKTLMSGHRFDLLRSSTLLSHWNWEIVEDDLLWE